MPCPLCWTTLDVAVQRIYSKSRAIKASWKDVRTFRATRKQVRVHGHTTSSNICVCEWYRTHARIPTDGQSLGCQTSEPAQYQRDHYRDLERDLEVPEISAVTIPPADGAIITMMTHHGVVPADARSEAMTFREDEISILIGSDFYWDIVTGHITRLSPQVTAVETRYGWTVQGTLHNFYQGSTVQSTSLVFGTGEPPREDAPTKSRKGKNHPPPTRLSTQNRRGSKSLPTMVACTSNGNSTTSPSMTMRNYVNTQVYKRRPSGMNAGAQRSSKAQHTRGRTYYTNATSSPDAPLLTWQTCNVLASRVRRHASPINKHRSATSKHASTSFSRPSVEALTQGVLADFALGTRGDTEAAPTTSSCRRRPGARRRFAAYPVEADTGDRTASWSRQRR
ncbi:hypothetical protein HPB49_000681 [Dermacentor silvarum]|uniref:Uncharacterized protein n=1 Tax=Dermacentor silvarum TaxID=543639 RepID=A0ACB8DS25_DERSI|nr:hypothetical protein HPB49_000681 [Dermacentor silvarum]